MLKKGTKFEAGYAVSRHGKDYREISRFVKEEFDWTMNHISARNYTLRALEKIAFEIIDALDENVDNFEEISKSPLFQDAIAEIFSEI